MHVFNFGYLIFLSYHRHEVGDYYSPDLPQWSRQAVIFYLAYKTFVLDVEISKCKNSVYVRKP